MTPTLPPNESLTVEFKSDLKRLPDRELVEAIVCLARACVRSGAAVIAVPQAAIDLAKRFEGFYRVPKHDPGRAHPYICPAGYWTIGYGHLCDPKHPPITETEAEVYLAQDLQTAFAATLRCCPVLTTEPEERLAAIVDFTFNLGAGRLQTSTLRRRVNQRDWIAAAQELRRWVYGGGKVLPGLVARRESEIKFLTDSSVMAKAR